MMKLVFFMLLVLFALSLVSNVIGSEELNAEVQWKRSRYGPGSLRWYQCPRACSHRCSRTRHHKPCMFFCQKCCRTCLCVPPGFAGNKQVCPCYNNWKTKEGRPKCP